MGGGFAALAALCIVAILTWRQHMRKAAVRNLELCAPMDDLPSAMGSGAGTGGLPGAPVQKQGSADSRDPLLQEARQTGMQRLLSCCLGDSRDGAALHADPVSDPRTSCVVLYSTSYSLERSTLFLKDLV